MPLASQPRWSGLVQRHPAPRARLPLALLGVMAGAACGEPAQRATASVACATQVVFDSDRSGTSEVYLLDLVSREATQLTRTTDTGAKSWLPDFAPGGREIVFVLSDESGNGQLFVVGADGSGLRQLTADDATYENPAWSPRGEWIAFEKAKQGVWGLYRIRPDGSDLQRIGPEGVNLFHPSWSPDERRIAVVTGEPEAWVAGVVDIETGGLQQLTEPALSVGSVTWAPDGSQVAVDAVIDSNLDIHLINLGSHELRRLTTNLAVDARPDWSPDGTQLMFHSTRDRGGSVLGQERWEEFELYVLDLATGGVERVTDNAWFDGHPDWCLPWPVD